MAQGQKEDLKQYAVDLPLLSKFLERHGVKKEEIVKLENGQVISFKASVQGSKDAIDFFFKVIPEASVLKIECQGLAEIPSDSKEYYKLLARIDDLNGTRTLGKYCTDKETKKVRYFYYRTVAGGLCYADFERTLKTIEYIVFNDLKALRDLKS
jgi:hypothetical protein